jgi:hypothetical protein
LNLKLWITNHPRDYDLGVFLAALLTQEPPKPTRLYLRSFQFPQQPTRDLLRDISRVHQPGPRPRPYPAREPFKTLELNCIDLYDRGFRLYPWININELTSLKLINCARIQPLLLEYAQLLHRSTTPPFRTFHVKHSVSDPGTVANPMFAIENVLRAAEGLKNILVSSSHDTLPAQNCITKHGKSFRMLLVYTEGRRSYSAAQTTAILQACPLLGLLAIRLPRLMLGSDDSWEQHWTLGHGVGNTKRIRDIIVS